MDKTVCYECVTSKYLAQYISTYASYKKCCYCGKGSNYNVAIKLEALYEYVFERVDYFYGPENREWKLTAIKDGFSDGLTTLDILQALSISNNTELIDDLIVKCPIEYWEYGNNESYMYMNYDEEGFLNLWDWFCNDIKHKVRFTFLNTSLYDDIPDAPEPVEVLNELTEILINRQMICSVNPGEKFHRVRPHADGEPEGFKHKDVSELCAPPSAKASNSRMSPQGVAAFYCASDESTAIAEVRQQDKPDIEGTHCIFDNMKKLTVLDLTCPIQVPDIFSNDYKKINKITMLKEIVMSMAEPIEKDGKVHLEYLPTQVFSEYVKFLLRYNNNQIDGIKYKSAQSQGDCYVFFCDRDNFLNVNGFSSDVWFKLIPESPKNIKIINNI